MFDSDDCDGGGGGDGAGGDDDDMFFRVSHPSRIDHYLRISESDRASGERRRMNSFLFSSTKLAKYLDARGHSDLTLADVAKPRSKGVERVSRDPQGGKLRASVTKFSCARCVKQSGGGAKLISRPQILVLVAVAPASSGPREGLGSETWWSAW